MKEIQTVNVWLWQLGQEMNMVSVSASCLCHHPSWWVWLSPLGFSPTTPLLPDLSVSCPTSLCVWGPPAAPSPTPTATHWCFPHLLPNRQSVFILSKRHSLSCSWPALLSHNAVVHTGSGGADCLINMKQKTSLSFKLWVSNSGRGTIFHASYLT